MLSYADGSTQTVLSRNDGSWRRGPGPTVWENLHLGVVHDARRETPGWQLSSFDDVTMHGYVAATQVADLSSTKWGVQTLANASLEVMLAVGESSVILLHSPLHLVGFSIGMERGCQQK